MAKKKISKETSLEETLWNSANKLRKNMDAAEYKHIVLGLVFLKYISDSFEELRKKLEKGEGEYEGADPDDPEEYRAENVFYVPEKARWEYLEGNAKKTTIGVDVDSAMELIENDNALLKGVLPKEYAKENLDKQSLGGLIDLIGTIPLGDTESKTKDVLGRVYEYFLGQFALEEGKKGGQFYTPTCLVNLLVAMLEPYEGRVFDPCCGSGGMFVSSEKFINAHSDRYRGKYTEIENLFDKVVSVYGQESNQTTWRLCKMNLALRGIDSSNIKWNNEGSFLKDAHEDLKADYIIANPPFNDGDWSGETLSDDYRWSYGIPPVSNANYAWIQHFVTHLSTTGKAGFLLATKSLASESNAEKEIRKGLIEDNLVECIVLLPGKLFYTTPAPVCLWILSRGKKTDKTLFIDASHNMEYKSLDRTHIQFTDDNIRTVCDTYHQWLNKFEEYRDIPGYCKSVSKSNITDSLYPGHYIGVNVTADDYKDRNISQKQVLSNLGEIGTRMSCLEQESAKFEELVKNAIANTSEKKIKVRLSDVLEESIEILGEKEEPEILSCTENAGLVLQSERFSKRVATEDTSKYKIVRKHDIVYNPYLLWAGAIDQCTIVDEGITSPAYMVFKVKEEYEPLIVGHVLKSEYMKKWYWNISIGTHERRRTASPEKFLNLEIELPDFDTQKEIKKLYSDLMQQIKVIGDLQAALASTASDLNEFFTGI
ncbi:MAG: N-6 DNA methylase [Hespellia sp.]|nr:N-6 DNA methylase [Hespellia sp.]